MPPKDRATLPLQWTRRDWGRYHGFKRWLYMRRKRLVELFEQNHDLYGSGWETVEMSLIREECEDMGLPMGYGRVGGLPQQLTWGALSPAEKVDWQEPDGVASEDEAPQRVPGSRAAASRGAEPSRSSQPRGRGRKMGPRGVR